MYRFIDKKTYLDWGLTSDWLISGPRKRKSFQKNILQSDCSIPNTSISRSHSKLKFGFENSSSEGYGEITEGSIERLFCFLEHINEKDTEAASSSSFAVTTPQKDLKKTSFSQVSYKLIPNESTFVDIGSGYGKVVFHAKLGAQFSYAVGIEYVESRANLATYIRDELLSENKSLLNCTDRKKLRSCVMIHADATKWKSFNFSHIYMYDRVFSENTLISLAAKLNNSSFRVLITYHRHEEWLRFGLKGTRLLKLITMRTTGGQNFRAYILLNEDFK